MVSYSVALTVSLWTKSTTKEWKYQRFSTNISLWHQDAFYWSLWSWRYCHRLMPQLNVQYSISTLFPVPLATNKTRTCTRYPPRKLLVNHKKPQQSCQTRQISDGPSTRSGAEIRFQACSWELDYLPGMCTTSHIQRSMQTLCIILSRGSYWNLISARSKSY